MLLPVNTRAEIGWDGFIHKNLNDYGYEKTGLKKGEDTGDSMFKESHYF